MMSSDGSLLKTPEVDAVVAASALEHQITGGFTFYELQDQIFDVLAVWIDRRTSHLWTTETLLVIVTISSVSLSVPVASSAIIAVVSMAMAFRQNRLRRQKNQQGDEQQIILVLHRTRSDRRILRMSADCQTHVLSFLLSDARPYIYALYWQS